MERRRLKNALAILSEGADAKAGQKYPDEAMQAKQDARQWLSEQSIQGFGIGSKVIGGVEQGELVVKVYVEEKRPRDQIDHPVPTEVRVPGIAEPVKTDVIAVGRIRRQTAFLDKSRPAAPGVSISIDQPEYGDIGMPSHAAGRRKSLYSQQLPCHGSVWSRCSPHAYLSA